MAFWRKRSRSAMAGSRVTAVPAEVLRGRVEDDVGTEFEWTLERGRGKRVVDHEQRPIRGIPETLSDGKGGGGDVHDLQERVRGRLEPDQARPLGHGLPERLGLAGQVHIACVDAVSAPDLLEVAVRAAVDIVADHDLRAGWRQLGDGRRRGGPGRERDPLPAPPEGPARGPEAG